MLLRKYAPEPVPRERKGLFSSPFIKRKGSLDSKVIVNNVVDAHRKSRFQRQGSDDPYMTSHVAGHMRGITNGCADRVSHGALRTNGLDRIERLSQGTGSSQSLSSTLSRHEHVLSVEVHRDSNGEGSRHSSRQELHYAAKQDPAVVSSQVTAAPIASHDNILYMKVQEADDLDKGPRDSPDLGVEDTSPTGTLDSTASEDFKDSKYGSSSTMSIGSDASPVAEQRKGQHHHAKATRKQVSAAHSLAFCLLSLHSLHSLLYVHVYGCFSN